MYAAVGISPVLDVDVDQVAGGGVLVARFSAREVLVLARWQDRSITGVGSHFALMTLWTVRVQVKVVGNRAGPQRLHITDDATLGACES